ncbi:TPA: SatD family protein, partial [Streptococcus agalactiae]
MYLALIGDIINSKQILERETFQQSFQQLMTELSDVYGEELISPFTITAGDEFQALLKPSKKVFQIIDHIQLALKPVNVRFGLGTGNIITSINSNESIGADGPAYWHARSAINHIHDKNDYGTVQVAICLDDEDQNLELTLNSLISAGDF